MAVARVGNPWVRNLTLQPSRIYAATPYRPYAGMFQNSSNISSDFFIRALSPFSVNDPNVIEAIRKEYNIIDNGSYRVAGNIGASVGAIGGAAASYLLYKGAFTALASKALYSSSIASAGAAMTATATKVGAASALTVNPVGLTISGVMLALAVAGTVMTSMELGRVVGASVGSKEGSIAMSRYLANLGSSLVKRPTTTILTGATIFLSNFALNQTPLKSPIVRQGITMGIMRGVRPIAESIDNKLFGKLDDIEQMSYTDLLQLQGDLADDFSGTTLVKGALAGIKGGMDKTSELVSKAYGRHEEGFDPLDFSDVRETWGVDVGTFGNGLIDILGEVVFDTDNNMNTVKNKIDTSISKSIANTVFRKILSDKNHYLFERYFKEVEGRVEAKDSVKNELQNKKLQTAVEKYLDKYIDPNTAKNKAEKAEIVKKNEQELDTAIGDIYNWIVSKTLGDDNSEAGKIKRREEAIKIVGFLKKEINEAFEGHTTVLETKAVNRKKYAKAVNKMVEAQKEAEKIVYKEFQDNKYNFDKALLKEFQIRKFNPSHEYITRLLKIQPIFRFYSEGNNTNMRILGYFTRPLQSITSSKRGRKIIHDTLNKSIRKFDPYDKFLKVDDIIHAKDENGEVSDKVVQKEKYEEKRNIIKSVKQILSDKLKSYETLMIRKLIGEEEAKYIIDELNRLESYKNSLTPEQKPEFEKAEKDYQAAKKLYEEYKEEAEEKLKEENNKVYKAHKERLKRISELYEQIEINESFIELYLENTKYIYVENKIATNREVNKETAKDVLAEIKRLRDKGKGNLTGDELSNLKDMENAYSFFTKEKLFDDSYRGLIKDYNAVLKHLVSYETWFADSEAKLQAYFLDTVVFQEVKQLSKEVQEFNKKPELTQDEAFLKNKEEIESRFKGKLKEAELLLDDLQIFDKETTQKIIKHIASGEPVDLPIYYATELFKILKLNDMNKNTFFFNNKELFDEINKGILNNQDLKIVLDKLKDQINYRARKDKQLDKASDSLKEDAKEIILGLLKKINSKKDKDGNKILSDEDYEVLKENIGSVLLNLINTHKLMIEDEETGYKMMAQRKRFSELSKNDVIDFVFKIAQTVDPNLTKASEAIDTHLKQIEQGMKNIVSALKVNGVDKASLFGKALHEYFRSQMYKINNSKLINAINSKYLRVGQAAKFFKADDLTAKEQAKLDKENAKTLESKMRDGRYTFESAEREELKRAMIEEVRKSIDASKNKELFGKLGLEKLINDSLAEIAKETDEEALKAENSKKPKTKKIFDTTFEKYKKVASNVISKMESSGKVLTEDEKRDISNSVYKAIYLQAEAIKQEIKLARSRTNVSQKTFENVFMKSISQSFYANFLDVRNLSSILRGDKTKPQTRIDMRPPKDGKGNEFRLAILNFMKDNPPTLENVLKLKLAHEGVYKNFYGVPIPLQRISQLGEENIIGKWAEMYNAEMNKKDDKIVLEFFGKYIPEEEGSEAYARYIDQSFDLPASLRKYFKNFTIKPKEFKKIKGDFESDGTLFGDVVKLLQSKLIGFKEISYYDVRDLIPRVIDEKRVINNEVRIIRVKTFEGKEYDFYVPKETVRNFGGKIVYTYKINGAEYMRIKFNSEEDKPLDYLKDIEDAIKTDFQSKKSVSEEFEEEFIPYRVQREMFRIFSRQRYVVESEQEESDFIFIDSEVNPQNKTEFERFMISHMVKLNEKEKKELSSNKSFIKIQKNKGRSLDATQSDPKVLFEMVELPSGDKASLTKIFTPLAKLTERPNRTALAINARRNAKRIDNPEAPLLQSDYLAKPENSEIEKLSHMGFNAKVYLSDKYFKDDDNNPNSTHNETALMKLSYAKKIFVRDGQEIKLSHGFKIMDRYSSKYGLRIVNDIGEDSEWNRMFAGDKKGLEANVVASRSAVSRRGLQNVELEMKINGSDDKNKVQRFVNSEAGSRKELDLFNRFGIEDSEKMESDFGFLYMYLMDDLDTNDGRGYRVANEDAKNGAKISIEEFQIFEALKYTVYNENKKQKVVDPNNVLFKFFWERSDINDSKLKEELFESNQSLTGKKGKFRKEIIERRMKHSLYGKAISNTSGLLKPITEDGNKIARVGISQEMAIRMGAGYLDENKMFQFHKNGNRMLLHRSPSQGRRSYAYVDVVVLKDESSMGLYQKAVEISPEVEAALNLDYDGDGVALFSLVGASKDVLEAAQKAFGHDYSKRTNYNDYNFVRHDDSRNERSFDINRDRSEIFGTGKYQKERKPFKDTFVKEEQWDNVIKDQKTLKDYSGKFKDIFDADYQDFISDVKKQEWFEKQSKLKKEFGSLYGLVTSVYDFYSQKSFDFSKHAKEGESESFEKIYKSIMRKGVYESFGDHIYRLVEVFKYDFEATRKKEEELKKISESNMTLAQKEKASNEVVKLYLNGLDSMLKETNTKYDEIINANKKANMKQDQPDEDIKLVNPEKVDEGEPFKQQYKEAKMMLIKEINERLNLEGDNQITEKDLVDFEEQNNIFSDEIMNKNKIDVFRLDDWDLKLSQLEIKQIFKFIFDQKISKIVGEVERGKTGGIKINKNQKIDEGRFEFRNKVSTPVKKYIKDYVEAFYTMDKKAFDNTYFVIKNRDGSEKRIPFYRMFKLVKAQEDGSLLPYSVNKNNLPPKINQRDIRISNEFNLLDEKFAGFYVETTTGYSSSKVESLNQQLYKDLGRVIIRELNDLGYTNHGVVNPLVPGKVIYQKKVFHNIYKSLVKNEEGLSIIGDLIKDIGDEEAKAEIIEILRPFFMHEAIAQFVLGDKRTNLFEYVYGIEDLFTDEKQVVIPKEEEKIKDLIQYGLIKVLPEGNADIDKFTDMIRERLYAENRKINEKNVRDAVNGTIEMFYKILRYSETNNRYNIFGQFVNSDVSFKIDFLLKLYQVKSGVFAKTEEAKLLGIKQEDFINHEGDFKPENYEMNSRKLSRFDRVYDYIYIRLGSSYLPGTSKVLDELEKEHSMINVVSSYVKNINRHLQKFRVEKIFIQNQTGEVNGEETVLYRSMLHPNNIEENTIILKNNRKNKTAANETQNHFRTLTTFRGVVGEDSEIAKETTRIGNDYKLGNDIMAIYLYDKGDAEVFVQLIKDVIDQKSTETIPLTKKLLNLYMLMNDLMIPLGMKDKVLTPGMVSAIYREIKNSPFVDNDGEIKMNNIYQIMFHEYVYGGKDNPLQHDERFMGAYSALMNFYTSNKEYNVTSFNPLGFVNTFFGKILYEREVTRQMANLPKKDRDRGKIRDEIVKAYLKRKEEIEALRELNKDESSYEYFKDMEESYESHKTIDTSKYTDDEEGQKNIKEKYSLYKNFKRLEEKKSGFIDTYEISKYSGFDGLSITKHSLFNIYAQLIGKKTMSSEEIDEMTESLYQEIIANNKEVGFEFKGPRKLHSAMIDAQLNLRVTELIIQKYNENPNRYKNIRYEDGRTIGDAIKEFSDLKNRKNFAVLDSENLVNISDYNRIHEIAIITFNEKGEPKYHQFFLSYKIDILTEMWYRNHGYTDEEIEFIKTRNKGLANLQHNKETYEKVFEILKDKNIIGQSIKTNIFSEGDVAKINYEYEKILKNEVVKEIKKYNKEEKDFLDKLKSSSTEDLFDQLEGVTSKEKFDLIMKVITDKLEEDLNERILGQGIERIETEEQVVFKEHIKGLLKVMVTEFDPVLIQAKFKEILGIDEIPMEIIVDIIKRFNDKFDELKGPDNDGALLMQWPTIVKNEDGFYEVKYTEVKESDFLEAGKTFEYRKVVYDENDVYSNYMFKSRAFYEILKDIKDLIRIKGLPVEVFGEKKQRSLSYAEYEKLKRRITLFEGEFDETDFDTKFHLDAAKKFKEEGNEVEYIISMNKAIKAARDYNLEDLDPFMNVDLDTGNKKIKKMLKKKLHTDYGPIANMEVWKIEKRLADQLSELYTKMIDSNRNLPKEEQQKNFQYLAKLKNIETALEYEDFTKLTYKRLSVIFGIDDMELVKDFYDDFMTTYMVYKSDGINFYYKGGKEAYSHLAYKPELENTFRKLAFYAILNPFSDEKYTIGSVLKSVLMEEPYREYEAFEYDSVKESKIEQITQRFTRRIEQDERNKTLFDNERLKVKNMILKEDWEGLEKYLADNPHYAGKLDDFKKEFYARFNELKNQGIQHFDIEWHWEGSKPQPFNKVTQKFKYYESAKGEFLRGVIYDFSKDINEMIYVNEHYTSIDTEKPIKKLLTYNYYIRNIESYNGSVVKGEDYRKYEEIRKNIKDSYSYLESDVTKTENLSNYQKDFFDMIEPFKYKKPAPNGDLYDYKRLFKEIDEGYLSKIYSITLITDASKKDLETIEGSTRRRNEKFQKELPKKIAALEEKIKFLRSSGTPEELKEAEILEGRIENLKKVNFRDNVYYDEEKIYNLRRQEAGWKDDKELFENEIASYETKEGTQDIEVLTWMDKMKDTPHPMLKIIELKSEDELRRLVQTLGEKAFLGFTLKHDILKTDEMSYEGYSLPKPIALLQSSVLKMQKFMMLMNSGFVVRNIYDGLIRNHELIVGSDNLISENLRFAREGINSWKLIFKYKAFSAAHGKEVQEIKGILDRISDLEKIENYSEMEMQQLKTEFIVKLTEKKQSIDNYLKNIIADEGQKEDKRASDNYISFFNASKAIGTIVKTLEDMEKNNQKLTTTTFKNLFTDYFRIYQEAGFFRQVIMNSSSNKIKLNFEDNSSKNVQKIKDELALVRFVNEIEKSGVISDQYEITGKKEIKKIYENIDKMLNDELINYGLNEKVDWLLSKHPLAWFTNIVEQTQRVHGVLLDVYVNGKTKERAFAESLSRFFNYGMKGAYEKSASVYFPFASFAVRNLDYYLEVLGDQRYVRMMTNVAQGMNTWYDEDEDENYRFSNSFNDFTANQGWIPISKNFGIKMGNAMFDAVSLIEDPFESGYQKLNPVLQQANNLSKGEGFDVNKLPTTTAFNRASGALNRIAGGPSSNPMIVDILPSLFYRRHEFTPYKYRIQYTSDYRNIYRSLFFDDGSRRTPSKNPHTTAKNIRYETYVRARLMGARR